MQEMQKTARLEDAQGDSRSGPQLDAAPQPLVVASGFSQLQCILQAPPVATGGPLSMTAPPCALFAGLPPLAPVRAPRAVDSRAPGAPRHSDHTDACAQRMATNDAMAAAAAMLAAPTPMRSPSSGGTDEWGVLPWGVLTQHLLLATASDDYETYEKEPMGAAKPRGASNNPFAFEAQPTPPMRAAQATAGGAPWSPAVAPLRTPAPAQRALAAAPPSPVGKSSFVGSAPSNDAGGIWGASVESLRVSPRTNSAAALRRVISGSTAATLLPRGCSTDQLYMLCEPHLACGAALGPAPVR
ncbi:hypothetical protein FOA52_005662 [Chlamydomonas sp. UWO 241]|nr:hypothetical protein FOA52_005662 [Chlamydomonas sp. UWO 241]